MARHGEMVMTVVVPAVGRAGQQDNGSEPGRAARVAVIDERAPVRTGLARAVALDPQLELALSSGCLRDAFAMSAAPDMIVLGRWHCDGTDAPQEHAGGEALACPILDVEAICATSPMPGQCAAALEDQGQGHELAVVSAIHATLEALSAAGARPPSPGATAGARPSARSEAQSGQPSLSPQERRALALYATGMTLDAVAEAMYVTPNTAATYLKRVRSKLRAAGGAVDSKLELRDCALAQGVIGW
jgi:DNA-binding CsgD family transcriptional regulator